MTIDEAIKHAEEVAEEKFNNGVSIMDKMKSDIALSNAEECKRCAEEHRQLAEWLKDYKRLLEQEPILDRDCEHCSKTYGTFGCCTTVSNKWVYSCKEGQREYLLDKIRAEIEAIEDGISSYYNDRPWIFKDEALDIIDKYKKESEG